MSDRQVYRQIPLQQRLCSYYQCQRPIERNIARTKDGRIWHYGCLMDAKDEKYQCLDCYLSFDATEASLIEKQVCRGDDVSERLSPVCPGCGCQNLKPLTTRAKITKEA